MINGMMSMSSKTQADKRLILIFCIVRSNK